MVEHLQKASFRREDSVGWRMNPGWIRRIPSFCFQEAQKENILTFGDGGVGGYLSNRSEVWHRSVMKPSILMQIMDMSSVFVAIEFAWKSF